ncbi:hypothetical protein LZ32DRAFT_379977 [Colletotrichum eremochloae]|nr:hypothetical protein LZ32DRAFT_379977 [Colletotrichum eremochloae]
MMPTGKKTFLLMFPDRAPTWIPPHRAVCRQRPSSRQRESTRSSLSIVGSCCQRLQETKSTHTLTHHTNVHRRPPPHNVKPPWPPLGSLGLLASWPFIMYHPASNLSPIRLRGDWVCICATANHKWLGVCFFPGVRRHLHAQSRAEPLSLSLCLLPLSHLLHTHCVSPWLPQVRGSSPNGNAMPDRRSAHHKSSPIPPAIGLNDKTYKKPTPPLLVAAGCYSGGMSWLLFLLFRHCAVIPCG